MKHARTLAGAAGLGLLAALPAWAQEAAAPAAAFVPDATMVRTCISTESMFFERTRPP